VDKATGEMQRECMGGYRVLLRLAELVRDEPVEGDLGEDELAVVGLETVAERPVGDEVTALHPLFPHQPDEERLSHLLLEEVNR
jgi:hypothetical protein